MIRNNGILNTRIQLNSGQVVQVYNSSNKHWTEQNTTQVISPMRSSSDWVARCKNDCFWLCALSCSQRCWYCRRSKWVLFLGIPLGCLLLHSPYYQFGTSLIHHNDIHASRETETDCWCQSLPWDDYPKINTLTQEFVWTSSWENLN